jgi:hypothetical protein
MGRPPWGAAGRRSPIREGSGHAPSRRPASARPDSGRSRTRDRRRAPAAGRGGLRSGGRASTRSQTRPSSRASRCRWDGHRSCAPPPRCVAARRHWRRATQPPRCESPCAFGTPSVRPLARFSSSSRVELLARARFRLRGRGWSSRAGPPPPGTRSDRGRCGRPRVPAARRPSVLLPSPPWVRRQGS